MIFSVGNFVENCETADTLLCQCMLDWFDVALDYQDCLLVTESTCKTVWICTVSRFSAWIYFFCEVCIIITVAN